MRLGLALAGRFLRSNKGQTLLIIIGIAIGVAVQIFIGSLIQGLQESLIDKTIGNASQVTISQENDQYFADDADLFATITTADTRITAASPVLEGAAFMSVDERSQSLLIRGLVIDAADRIYNIYDRIIEGTYPQTADEIILGSDVRDEYSLTVGDTVRLTTPAGIAQTKTIVGFFDFQVAAINSNWGIVTLPAAQDLFGAAGQLSSIELKLDDAAIFAADEIAATLADTLGTDYIVDNWQAQNASLLSGLQGQSMSSYIIQVFVMISVVLAIASVLAITVMQKSRQIGILKAMGIKNRTSGYIFMFEGLILGVAGVLLGVLLGIGLMYMFSIFALNPDGTPVVALYINPGFIIISAVIAIVAATAAALIPAWRSAKLDPIEIIRNN